MAHEPSSMGASLLTEGLANVGRLDEIVDIVQQATGHDRQTCLQLIQQRLDTDPAYWHSLQQILNQGTGEMYAEVMLKDGFKQDAEDPRTWSTPDGPLDSEWPAMLKKIGFTQDSEDPRVWHAEYRLFPDQRPSPPAWTPSEE